MKRIRIYLLLCLLVFFAVDALAKGPEYVEGSKVEFYIAPCDTFVVLFGTESITYIGKVLNESTRNIRIQICDNSTIKFLPKRNILSINGVPYSFTPINPDDMQHIQDSGSFIMVQMENGNSFVGKIQRQNTDTLFLETTDVGLVTLPKRSIRRIKPLSQKEVASGVFTTSQSVNTRYLFGTNGYGIDRGTGYYQNTWVLFNQFSVGATDHLSVGGGLVPLFFFGAPTPVWGTVKYSLPLKSESFHTSVGTLFGTIIGADEGGFGLVFAQATFGSRVSNVNIGIGYGYADGDFGNRPTLTFSAITPVGKKAAFITENYLISTGYETVGILSTGFRFYLKSVSLDGALFAPVGEDVGFFVFPWLGLSVPFGE